jgi:uncharacterized protein
LTVQMNESALAAKVEHLKAQLAAHAPLVIAYSGGVDSAYLLAAAHAALGDRAFGVIADSASLPRQALKEALDLARQIGARVEVVATEELQDERYASNPVNRCYFCKAELFTKLDALARDRGYAGIAYGENADDMRQVRPGRLAAEKFQVIAPLRDAGLTKAEIRALSRVMDLPTADAPAQPCLSSRIPHGTPVTVEALGMIERGETLVRSLGFKVFRVRHMALDQETRARVQIAPEEMAGIGPVTETLVSGLRAVGYDDVEIDPAGYRSPGA